MSGQKFNTYNLIQKQLEMMLQTTYDVSHAEKHVYRIILPSSYY